MAADNGPKTVVALWAMTAVSFLFMNLRFFCKGVYTRQLRVDDAILLLSWVRAPRKSLASPSAQLLKAASGLRPTIRRAHNSVRSQWNGKTCRRSQSRYRCTNVQVLVSGRVLHTTSYSRLQVVLLDHASPYRHKEMANPVHLVRHCYNQYCLLGDGDSAFGAVPAYC